VSEVNKAALREKISDIYVLLLLSVYILFVTPKGYRAIVEAKYAAFMTLSLAYIVIMFVAGSRPRMKLPQAAALLYLLFTAISAVLSPYKSQVFLGGSRKDGLLTIAVYCLVFILLLQYYKPKRRHLYVFAVVMAAFCFITFLQMLGLDPLNLYPAGLSYADANIKYSGVYIGTLGNANMAAAVLAMAVPAFVMAALFKRKKAAEVLLLVPAAMCMMVLVETGSSAGAAAAAAAVILLFPAAVETKRARQRAWFAVAVAAAALFTFIWAYNGRGYGIFYQAHCMIHGKIDESFGSGRVFIWKSVLPLARERLLFGGGPDTLGLRDLQPYEWLRADGTLVRSAITAAHSEYLNILVNQGLLALLAFLALPVMSVIKAYKAKANAAVSICAAAAAGYLLQAFFGVGMCINAPFLWLAMAVILAEKDENKEGVKF